MEYTLNAAAPCSRAAGRGGAFASASTAVSTAPRSFPAPVGPPTGRPLPLAGPPTGPLSPAPASLAQPSSRARCCSAAAAKAGRLPSQAEACMPRCLGWENESAARACKGRSRCPRPPRSKDKDGRRAPSPRHQTVLEGSMPLSLNVAADSSFRVAIHIPDVSVVPPDDDCL